MNILIFNWRDIRHEWAGGGEVYIHEIAKRWVSLGHNVTLFCGQDVRMKLPDEEITDGFRVVRKGGRFTLYFWAIWYYFSRFRKNTDVIVDVQNGIPFFTVFYSRKPKIAIVYHIHGKQFFIELPFPYNIVGFLIERFVFPFFYKNVPIQVISQTTKDDVVERGIPEKNIRIIYCGMEQPKNGLTDPVKFSVPTVLYLGRIKKYKRVDMLVKIMPEILKKVPTARLLIAGWGTEASSVTDATMRSRVRKKIRIYGPVTASEKRNLLQKSWVFVNPSINEGWGISVIEANQFGTPAVAFDVPGLSESIRHGKTGLLAKNEEEFIAHITHLLTDHVLRSKMAKESYRWSRVFSWDRAAKESLQFILDSRKK